MRLSIAVILTCFAIVGLSRADQSLASVTRQSTTIPPQSLSTALQTLAKKRNFQIVCRADLVERFRTAGISGELTPREALAQLLVGTGLTYRNLDEETVTIVPIVPTPNDKASSSLLGDDRGVATYSSSASNDSAPVFFTLAATLRFAGERSAIAQTAGDSTTKTSDSELGAIVVTASKIGTELDRAPVAVSYLSSDALTADHMDSIESVSAVIPSLEYASAFGAGEAFIRGIGTQFSQAGSETSVATYVDGVYLQRQVGVNEPIVDLKDVTVLKGPQGTLYGRNATGGAILLETNDPTQDFGGYADAEYGTFQHYKGDAVLNLPLDSKTAVRIAAQGYTENGYMHDVVSGRTVGRDNGATVRTKILSNLTDNLQITLTYEYGETSWDGFGQHQELRAPLCVGCAVSGLEPPTGYYDVFTNANLGPLSESKYSTGTLRVIYDRPTFTITSISNYREQNSSSSSDQDQTSANLENAGTDEKGPTIYSDLYARSKSDGPLNGLVGLTYERDRSTLTLPLSGNVFGGITDIVSQQKVQLNSYSGYLEGTYDFGPGFRVLAGGRYDVDAKGYQGMNSPGAALIAGGVTRYGRNGRWNEFTPRVVLSYDGNDLGYYYLSYSKGAKSGGFGLPSLVAANALQPETLDSYEIGAKNRFLDGRLRTNVDFFYGIYKNVVVSLYNPQSGSEKSQNAASARLEGVEFDSTMVVSDLFKISAGWAWMHNRWKSYSNAAVFAPAPAGGLGLVNSTEDLDGTPLPKSPDFSGYVGVDYGVTIYREWVARANVIGRYTSRFLFNAGGGGPLALDEQAGYFKADGTLMFSNPHSPVSFGVYSLNLTNRRYAEYGTTSTFGAQIVPARPRTYGVRIAVKF